MNPISVNTYPAIQKQSTKNPSLRFAGGADDADGVNPKQFARAKDTWRKVVQENQEQDPQAAHPVNQALAQDPLFKQIYSDMGVDLDSPEHYREQLAHLAFAGLLDRNMYKHTLGTHQRIVELDVSLDLGHLDRQLAKCLKLSAKDTPDYILFHRYNNAIKSLIAQAEKVSEDSEISNPLSLLQLQFSNNETAQDEVIIDTHILNILLQEKITETPEDVPCLNQEQLNLVSKINQGTLQILTQIDGEKSQKAYNHYFKALSQLIPASSESNNENPFEAVIEKTTIKERIDVLLDSIEEYYPQLNEEFGLNIITVGEKRYPMLCPKINVF